MNRQKKHTQAFVLVALLFLLFGGLTVLIQLLLPHLRDVFQLHYSDAAYILLSFFLSYLFFSIPAGFILTKIGYQRGIILGLLLISLGALLFYPAAGERLYWVFLTAIFVLGCGVTFLQVAMNSYIVILGDEATTPRRLTFSQAFNAIGTTIAPIFGATYLLSNEIKKEAEIEALDTTDKLIYFREEAFSIQLPFLYIALWALALAFVFAVVKLPYAYRIKEEVNKDSYWNLLKKTPLLLGAIGIFLYVGAEVVIGSYAVNYFINMNITKDIYVLYCRNAWLIGGETLSNLSRPQGCYSCFSHFLLGRCYVRTLYQCLSHQVDCSRQSSHCFCYSCHLSYFVFYQYRWFALNVDFIKYRPLQLYDVSHYLCACL